MPNQGTYSLMDMESVKKDAAKSFTYLKSKIPKLANKDYVVVLLGETHGNQVDQTVTSSILRVPPYVVDQHTRVIYERRLDDVYVHGDAFTSARTEPIDLTLNRRNRSTNIAKMIQDAFEDHDINVVYVPCGSAHATEIYDSLNKRYEKKFAYIVKMSSTD